MLLHDNAASGNCLKCRLLLRELGLQYTTVELDLFGGETSAWPDRIESRPGFVNDLAPLPSHAAAARPDPPAPPVDL